MLIQKTISLTNIHVSHKVQNSPPKASCYNRLIPMNHRRDSMRILVIEDEKRLAFTLADMIGGAGYYTDVSP